MATSNLSRSNHGFYLPEDLIIDILSRLPVKSLIRSAVVCKAWYALLKNPNFISKHLIQSSENPHLKLSSLLVLSINYDTLTYSMLSYSENSLDKYVSLDFPFMRTIYEIAVVGVCNGLVCISNLSGHDFNLVICNPAIMNFHKLPDCNFWYEFCIEYGKALLGFRYDPNGNEFKLIKILRYENEDKEYVRTEIYTMSTNSWSEIKTMIHFTKLDETRDSFASTIIDGVFYWEGENSRSGEAFIWSFDMNDEMYREIDGPERYEGEWDDLIWEIIQLEEELAMFVSISERCYNVWTLNQNGTCWNEKLKIGPFPTIERPRQIMVTRDINVAGVSKDEVLIVKDNAVLNDIKFFLYNLESQEIKILPFTDRMYNFKVFWYTESLLPAN